MNSPQRKITMSGIACLRKLYDKRAALLLELGYVANGRLTDSGLDYLRQKNLVEAANA